MHPPRIILVPVDLSGCSYTAANQAAYLARKLSASIRLLYVVPPNLSESQRDELERLVDILGQLGVRDVELRTVKGSPADVIVEESAFDRCDLVVMGTHGHSGLLHRLKGSVAETVVENASCPVLIVPRTKSIESFAEADDEDVTWTGTKKENDTWPGPV
jgi:nucleotide-binding universal stress UspA family protein